MKSNEKPCTKTKKVINRGKRSKSLSEVKPVKNISKDLQSFLETRPDQKKSFLYINCKAIPMGNRILSD